MRYVWRRLREISPFILDAVLAALIGVSELVWLLIADRAAERNSDALLVLLVLIGCGALAWRRRAPAVVLLVVATCFYAGLLLRYPSALEVAAAVATWTAVVRPSRVRLYHIGVGVAPVIPLARLDDAPAERVGDAVAVVLLIVITALVAHNLRLRRDRRLDEARRIEAEVARAASDERLRLARELHDIVAHAMSIVAVQAGVAAHVIDEQPEEAKHMLETVRVSSREALDELRRLLGVLRGEPVDHEPTPHLGRIDALAESLRSAGVQVDVRRVGDSDWVPRGLQATVYRVVQEALTNVLKHSQASRVEVTVDCGLTAVAVEVRDDGRAVASEPARGHGLLGMRERVAAFGGELHAAPAAGGGFHVTATIPYQRT